MSPNQRTNTGSMRPPLNTQRTSPERIVPLASPPLSSLVGRGRARSMRASGLSRTKLGLTSQREGGELMDKRDAAVSFLNALGVRWWAQVLRGIAAIAFGVLAIAMPRDSLVVLVYLFGVYAIVDGVFNLTVAAQRGS